MFRIFALSIMISAIAGCSQPEPEVIDMDEMAAEAGLAPEDYTVHENGAMEIKSKLGAAPKVEDVIAAFKDEGLPLGEIIIQTAETDPNERLGRPGEYVGSAQFEDTRVEQPEPMSELEFDEPDLPVGGVIEVFESNKDLQTRKQYLEQVYEAMPLVKQYMYASELGLLRLEFSLTPDQAKEYETVFMSL
ncbi:hypothetical protein [Psychrobacter sp. 72-O-c]|uniref:hypothetical protein n=1 Tax=Psychrobacter sp. 72-O-c TaxID=2774125 RepID=UPI00191882A5|nr:hypothetical protein [Psychrobacter sp. 72-O-c]